MHTRNTIVWCNHVVYEYANIKHDFFVCHPGTGGNNHAVDYYKETHYPLAVKLGTITPDGAGTVMLIQFQMQLNLL